MTAVAGQLSQSLAVLVATLSPIYEGEEDLGPIKGGAAAPGKEIRSFSLG
jgi:hypothetical protein